MLTAKKCLVRLENTVGVDLDLFIYLFFIQIKRHHIILNYQNGRRAKGRPNLFFTSKYSYSNDIIE